jgi:glycosyltransferase involved in cell wall biosynthesis
VDFIGGVADVAPHVKKCRFEVCPLLQGAGTRIKVLESLAFGKPVVSTTIGAHGLDVGEDQGVIRRDEPAAFADACVGLLRDQPRCAALGIRGRDAVRETYGPASFERRLRELASAILST